MASFCIRYKDKNIIDYLEKSILNIKEELIIKKYYLEESKIVIYYNEKNNNEILLFLANIITMCILEKFENIIVRKMILQNYFYFEKKELKKIIMLSEDILNSNMNVEYENDLYNLNLKNQKLKDCILDYVMENTEVNLLGLITFRIKEYLKYLDIAIDIAVNKFIIDKEYINFINMLKIYVDMEPSKIDIVKIIYNNDDVKLLDKNNNEIEYYEKNNRLELISDINFSSNDYIFNCILSLIPKNIIVYTLNENDEFINTLKRVFRERIQIENNMDLYKINQ